MKQLFDEELIHLSRIIHKLFLLVYIALDEYLDDFDFQNFCHNMYHKDHNYHRVNIYNDD